MLDVARGEVGGVGDLGGEVGRVLGGLAAEMVEGGVGGSLVVVKAGGRGWGDHKGARKHIALCVT